MGAHLFGEQDLDDLASPGCLCYSFPACSGGTLPEGPNQVPPVQTAKEEEPITE